MNLLERLDERLVAVARPIKLLTALSWPSPVIDEFLDHHRRGNRQLPTPPAVPPPPEGSLWELEAIATEADGHDEPLLDFIAASARSYATACYMLQSAGTPQFSEHSRALYGSPEDPILGAQRSHATAARHLLNVTERLAAVGALPEAKVCLTAATVRDELHGAFQRFFGARAPVIEIDANLASKAAAGSSRVRLRDGTCFSELDVAQLREHEGFVHTATAINGRLQPVLRSLGLGAPRTTATQEGIATFAELATRSTDVARLRRIALRTVAIENALNGADYIETFEFFREAGQNEDESAHSAMRVFRGGDVRGRVAFTKDVVYLHGLISVHVFLHRAIIEARPEWIARLFAGRLTLSDLGTFEDAFESEALVAGQYVPRWAREMPQLAAYLSFNTVANWIDLEHVRLHQPDAPSR